MSRAKRALLGLFALAVVVVPPVAHAREVKHCGITIAKGKTGTLVKDVECGQHCIDDPTVNCVVPTPGDDPVCPLAMPNSGCAIDVIKLEKNATLDLNGFTFTPFRDNKGIVCSDDGGGRCTIKGPGTIAGGKDVAIDPGNTSLALEDLTVRHFYRSVTIKGWLYLTNVIVDSLTGLYGEKGMRAKNVTVRDESGIGSLKTSYADGITLEADGAIFGGKSVRARNVTGESGGVVNGQNVYLTNSNMPGAWVRAERTVRLVTSLAVSIESGKRPVLVDSSCTMSLKAGTTESWGVCSGD